MSVITVDTKNRNESLLVKAKAIADGDGLAFNRHNRWAKDTTFENLMETAVKHASLARDYKITFNDIQFSPAADSKTINLEFKDNILQILPSFLYTFSHFINGSSCLSGVTATLLSSLCINTQRNRCKDNEDLTLAGLHLLRHIISHLRSGFVTNKGEPKKILLRTIQNQNTFARALLSHNYRTDLSCLWLLKLITDLVDIPDEVRAFYTGQLLEVEVSINPKEILAPDDRYATGFYFYCGEVGNRSAGVVPYVRLNNQYSGFFFGDEISINHNTKLALDECSKVFEEGVQHQIPLFSTYVNKLLKLTEIILKPVNEDRWFLERILLDLNSHLGMTLKELREWRVNYLALDNKISDENEVCAHDIYESFLAMTSKLEDPARRFSLNKLSYKLIDLKWETIRSRIEVISDKKVAKAFKFEEED